MGHGQDAEKIRQRYWKVTAEAKVEQRTSSTRNLDLSLLHSHGLADGFFEHPAAVLALCVMSQCLIARD
jgi:hypothetical protein